MLEQNNLYEFLTSLKIFEFFECFVTPAIALRLSSVRRQSIDDNRQALADVHIVYLDYGIYHYIYIYIYIHKYIIIIIGTSLSGS